MISIHALLAESDSRRSHCGPSRTISIHALLAESDCKSCKREVEVKNFYPRSPCGERRLIVLCRCAKNIFLSTLSLRRATQILTCFSALFAYFYPRSPCGERPSAKTLLPQPKDFYPRSPCGERRFVAQRLVLRLLISIHALLAESD